MPRAAYDETFQWWPTYQWWLDGPSFGTFEGRLVFRQGVILSSGPFTDSFGYITTDWASAFAGFLEFGTELFTWDLNQATVIESPQFPGTPLTVYMVEQANYPHFPLYYRLWVNPTVRWNG